MQNQELVHEFIEWVMDNYGIRLIAKKSDANLFEELFPDLAERLEKLDNEAVDNCT